MKNGGAWPPEGRRTRPEEGLFRGAFLAGNWHVVCDFDGTITPFDVTDAILQRFALPAWEAAEEAWTGGRISARECMDIQFPCCARTGRNWTPFWIPCLWMRVFSISSPVAGTPGPRLPSSATAWITPSGEFSPPTAWGGCRLWPIIWSRKEAPGTGLPFPTVRPTALRGCASAGPPTPERAGSCLSATAVPISVLPGTRPLSLRKRTGNFYGFAGKKAIPMPGTAIFATFSASSACGKLA